MWGSKFLLNLLVLLLANKLRESYCVIVDNNPYHHREILDTRGKYTLEWLFSKETNTIIFNVTVKSTGYIGFGLNQRGVMNGADIVIGGVDAKGQSYFTDMYVTKNRTLLPDTKQDYKLLGAWENGGFTSLRFSRLVDTCDVNDYLISEDQLAILWAYGERDDLGNHYQNRGWFSAYLLDPEKSPDIDDLVSQRKQPTRPSDDGPVISWKLKRRITLPEQRTSYWCSIHAAPKLPHKHHVIGFRTYLENEIARRHTHHLLVYRCMAPEGLDPQLIFEPFTRYPGEECYLNENRRLPINLCRTVLSVWGYGGKPFFLPEDVGFAIGESQNEYLLLEVHYDNPDIRSDLEFESGVEYFMTPKTRPRDGGIITVGFDIPGSLAAIPPGSPNFSLLGHCNPNCTRTMAPPTGIDVVAVGLHAHGAARRIRLRQFRKNVELPWIMNDDNYNPNFQQVRLLDTERKIMPDDHLISRCVYDNTEANGTTTITGFGTPDEMCLSFVVIANRIPYYRCTSEYPAQKLLAVFGVQDVVWDVERQQRIVLSPQHLRGLTLGQVGEYHVKWTEALREKLERDQLFSPHIVTCPSSAPPSLPSFLASFALQIGSNVASSVAQGGGQQLRQVVQQGISQVVQLGIRGIQQSLSPLQQVLAPLQQAGQGGQGPQQLGGTLQSLLSSLGGGQQSQQQLGGAFQSILSSLGGGQQSQQQLGGTVQSALSSVGGGQTSQPPQPPGPVLGGVAGIPPIFPQGTPPTGMAGLGMPPNVVYPASARVYRPEPTCTRLPKREEFNKVVAPKLDNIRGPISDNGLKRSFVRL